MSMPFDVIGLGIILVAIFSIVLYAGKSTGISMIFALPVTGFLYYFFPYEEKLTTLLKTPLQLEVMRGVILALFFIFCYIIIRRSVSVVFSWNSFGKIIEAGIISVIFTGLLALLVSRVVDPTLITNSLPLLGKLFTVPNIIFFWPIGSFIALYFVLDR